MKIVLIHFHLKRGGVTSVIRHQVDAIQALGWECLVLSGEPLTTIFPCEVQVVNGLAYDRLLSPGLTVNGISDVIMGIFQRKWSRWPDVVHVHNPTLAKNRHLQAVLSNLQQNGLRILCQIHDFAEDGRPEAYYESPYLEDCHYMVINPRDFKLLQEAGLQVEGCHLLPNAISLGPTNRHAFSEKSGVLYPVRAIRRKNIGEAVLLSIFLRENDLLIVTLPPNSPHDCTCYQQWKGFVRHNGLPVQFDAGLETDFSTLMERCRFVITTSITEGFGFAFLEAWAAGKALWGRLLPDICQGFMDHGLHMDGLYRQIWVPLTWIDREMLKSRWTSALAAARGQFELPANQDILDRAWQAATVNECIDFGLLDEPFQTLVIKRVISSSSDRLRLITLNPCLEQPGPPDQQGSVVDGNRQVVEQHYGPRSYAIRIEEIYRRVASTPIVHRLDKEMLARAFLSPNQFSLLKWGKCHG